MEIVGGGEKAGCGDVLRKIASADVSCAGVGAGSNRHNGRVGLTERGTAQHCGKL